VTDAGGTACVRREFDGNYRPGIGSTGLHWNIGEKYHYEHIFIQI